MSNQICLKWNSFLNNIATSFESLWEEEGLVDVTLASDGQCLTAHKVILSASSPFFKKVFQTNPCQHPVIILQDVHFSELEALLIFIYKGEVHIEQKNLPALLKAAETLQIRGLSGGDISAEESYKKLAELEQAVKESEATTKEEIPKKKQKLIKYKNNSILENALSQLNTTDGSATSDEGRSEGDYGSQKHVQNPIYQRFEMKTELLDTVDDLHKQSAEKDPGERLDTGQIDGIQENVEHGEEIPEEQIPQKGAHIIETYSGFARAVRKRCRECYRKLSEQTGAALAAKKAKRVITFCRFCKNQPPLCLQCFQEIHNRSSMPSVTVIAEARETSIPSPEVQIRARFPIGFDLTTPRPSSESTEELQLPNPPCSESTIDQSKPTNILMEQNARVLQPGFPSCTGTASNSDIPEEEIVKGSAAYPPFPCPFCDRAYTSWGFRRRHIKAVHTISPSLNCKWCLQVLPTHAAWRRHVILAHNLSANDAHNGLLILEEAHMVLQIARPTRLHTLVNIIKQNSQQISNQDNPQSNKD